MNIESSAETSEREALVERVVSQARDRGVQINRYALGVNYRPSGSGLGHVIDESHLELQALYITAESWKEAGAVNLPTEEVVTVALEHELIHEVHRSRARRGLTFPLDTTALESVIHDVQQRAEYLEAKEKHLSPKTIEWLKRINRKAREKHFVPLENLANSKIPVADVYKGIIERINTEVSSQEYLRALGILKDS